MAYQYDPASGALTTVEDAQTGFVYWQAASGAATVDAFGHLLAWTDGNNVSTVLGYDAATGVPTGISTGIGQSTAVQYLTYIWDGYGNLTERQDANQNLSETFQYDDLNRLKGSTVTNPANNGPTLSNIKYDAVGDITTRTLSGTSETYNYDPNHPYAVNGVTDSSGTIYSASYDADGDMTSRNGYPLTWTVSNLPASLASAQGSSTFSYDPEGQRYYQLATFNGATTDTTYIGGLFEVVSTSTTTEYRHNIIADGEIVAVHTIDQSGAASTSYLHSDHLGSVDAITDDSGAVIQTMSFDAYGVRRDATNWDYDLSQNTLTTLKDYTDRGYTDQEQLDNVALVDLNGRVYDPTVGRFISADPTVPAPLFSQAFNRYSYVYNDPLRYIDPSGYVNWPLLGLGVLQLGTGVSSTLGGGSLAVTGVIAIGFGAGTSGFGVGILLIGAGGTATVVGIANATTGVSDIVQSGEDIYSSLFGNGSVPPDAITQIYGPTTGDLLTDISFIHDLLTKATETLAQKALEAALKQAAQNAANKNNQVNPPSNSGSGTGSPGINNGNGNNGGNLIQLPSGCGCDGSYTGPNETINLGKIFVTPPPPPQPICMDGSGKVITCPT